MFSIRDESWGKQINKKQHIFDVYTLCYDPLSGLLIIIVYAFKQGF